MLGSRKHQINSGGIFIAVQIKAIRHSALVYAEMIDAAISPKVVRIAA